ncbi:MAG: hypothetical protein ABSF27_01940 [Candidatus Dormibacteria bacterium]|jgi:hypothetical protein
MTIDELWETILGSAPADWVHHELVPNPAQHTSFAAFRPDIGVGLQWGATCVAKFEESWVARFPDRSAYSVWVDSLFQGHMVDRTALVIVDGGRCYLPLPQGMDRTSVIERDYRLARLIQGIVHRNQSLVDSYLETAGVQRPG